MIARFDHVIIKFKHHGVWKVALWPDSEWCKVVTMFDRLGELVGKYEGITGE